MKEQFDQLFNNKRRNLAKNYNSQKRKYKWVNKLVKLLFWILFFGLSIEYKLYEILSGINNKELIIVLYLFLFLSLYSLLTWIIEYLLIYRLNRKYQLSNQDTRSWWLDKIKHFFLNLIFLYLSARLILYLIKVYPDNWWIYFSFTGIIFYTVITFLLPYVILPLFYKLEKYPENSLRKRLMNFIKKIDLKVDDIYQIDLSSKVNFANAAVIGLGKSRKIILGDNLKDKYTDDEIEAVLAHELGHHVHKDIIKNLIINGAGLFFTAFIISKLWYNLITYIEYTAIEIYSLPLLLVVWSLLFLLISPLELYLSRRFEENADNFALNNIENPENLGKGLAKLADESLSEIEYNLYELLFEASHPSIGKRVEKSLEWKN
ncbi:MAG: M48 family metalloprotease [Bacillota bacterium]